MCTNAKEISGFLFIKSTGHKYIAQKVRRKVASKVWKRLWCSVRKVEGFGVQIQFNNTISCSRSDLRQKEKESSIIIPHSAIVYRINSKTMQFAFGISPGKGRKLLLSLSTNSETETQRWMENIRYLLYLKEDCCIKQSYSISIVDNAHSKAAKLLGLYGSLTAAEGGIFIKNPHTDEIKSFKWQEFDEFHLMTTGRPEDVKRICVMHTTKEFSSGIGELHLFSFDADKLLQDLVTQGRGPSYKRKFLNFNNKTYEATKQCNKFTHSLSQHNLLHTLDIKTDWTPLHSKAKENVYQSIPAILMCDRELDSHNYKESNISFVSGIYEEIRDNVCSIKSKNTSNIYESIDQIVCNLQLKPPPLPPRQGQKSEHVETVRASTREYFYGEVYNVKKKPQNTKVCMQETTFVDNSNYVPMSPQLRGHNVLKSHVKENTKQDEYVIMQ